MTGFKASCRPFPSRWATCAFVPTWRQEQTRAWSGCDSPGELSCPSRGLSCRLQATSAEQTPVQHSAAQAPHHLAVPSHRRPSCPTGFCSCHREKWRAMGTSYFCRDSSWSQDKKFSQWEQPVIGIISPGKWQTLQHWMCLGFGWTRCWEYCLDHAFAKKSWTRWSLRSLPTTSPWFL